MRAYASSLPAVLASLLAGCGPQPIDDTVTATDPATTGTTGPVDPTMDTTVDPTMDTTVDPTVDPTSTTTIDTTSDTTVDPTSTTTDVTTDPVDTTSDGTSSGSTTDPATTDSTGDTTDATGDSSTGEPGEDLPPVLESFLVDGTTTPPPVFAPATLQLAAVATDDKGVAAVDFFLDDALLSSDEQAPFTAQLIVQSAADNGGHAVRAVARDTIGQEAASEEITIVVDLPQGGGGQVEWSQLLPGEGVALAVGPDFLMLTGELDGELWVEQRTLDTGEVVWSKKYGGGVGQDIAVLADPLRIAVGGQRNGESWTGLLDGSGALLWGVPVTLTADARVAFSPDQEVVVGYSGVHPVDNFQTHSVSRLTLAGEPAGKVTSGDYAFGGLAVGADGKIALVIGNYSLLGASALTRLFDVDDAELWTAEEDFQRQGNGVAIDGNGRVASVGGWLSGEDIGAPHNGWLIVRDAAGALQWESLLGDGELPDSFDAVATHVGGSLAVTGRLAMNFAEGVAITRKYSVDGDAVWTALHSGGGDLQPERGVDVGLDAAGAVYVLARESIPNTLVDQVRLIKYSP